MASVKFLFLIRQEKISGIREKTGCLHGMEKTQLCKLIMFGYGLYDEGDLPDWILSPKN